MEMLVEEDQELSVHFPWVCTHKGNLTDSPMFVTLAQSFSQILFQFFVAMVFLIAGCPTWTAVSSKTAIVTNCCMGVWLNIYLALMTIKHLST